MFLIDGTHIEENTSKALTAGAVDFKGPGELGAGNHAFGMQHLTELASGPLHELGQFLSPVCSVYYVYWVSSVYLLN